MNKPPLVLRARLRHSVCALAIGLLMPWPAMAAGEEVVTDTPLPIEVVTREDIERLPRGRDLLSILDLHNQVRADVGSPPLRWNPTLAENAQEWARTVARTGSGQHSSRVGRENERENIVVGPLSAISPVDMAQFWANEKSLFRPGVFPDVCSGDWSQCAHYSQMIWSNTTDIGCGYAADTYVALVCRYSPKGNIDGKLVIDLTFAPPVIAVNNTPDPNAGCRVPPPEEWVKALRASGFALDSADPRDAAIDRQWGLALEREQTVQDRMMTELATTQGNVATGINAYLAATSAWQGDYVYLASSTTGLQGLLTEWLEAREVYEKADLAFALANLGVGGVKLGFKAYRFLTAPKAVAVATTEAAAAGATRLAGTADNAAAAGEAGAAAAVGEARTAAASETQIFNRTLIPPGQNPNVRGMPGFTGTTSVAGDAADVARANWQREVDMMRRWVDEAVAAGDEATAQANRTALEGLLREGPRVASAAPAVQVTQAAQAVADLEPSFVAAAREAGLNVENIVAGAGNVEAQNLALMRAIAQARGWHDMPRWAGDPIANVLLQARKALAGVPDARISPQQLEVVKSLKTYVESRGLNFADWLRTAAGETTNTVGRLLPGQTEGVSGVIRYYDDADIDLLLKAIDAGGDAAALRTAVSPVAQASLNGLGRAAQAGTEGAASCGALEAGLALNVNDLANQAATAAGRAPPAGAAPAALGAPTDAQLANVLYGTGKLGEVGLGDVIDQFGVTDRFTAGQGLPRAMVGELWELISSPSTTVASHYFTFQAQDEYLNLLRNEGPRLRDLGAKLNDASNALRDLQATLQRAGLSGPSSYLGTRGPADLQRALADLQKVYDSGSPEWQRSHKAEMDARRAHIAQKLTALAETVADLNALAAKMATLRNWLDSLRLNATGGVRPVTDLFNPIVFVRLGSISLYLRGMGADAFGLTSGTPFRMHVPPSPPPAAGAPADDFEQMRARAAASVRAIEEAPEAEVDPTLEEWLNSQ